MKTKAGVRQVEVAHVEQEQVTHADDLVVAEEPLEIRLVHGPDGRRRETSIAVTMRTPGRDLDLAAGFLYTEGIIRHRSELLRIAHCVTVRPEEAGNVVKAELLPALRPDIGRLTRHFYTSSSCGVCGKASIEAVRQQSCRVFPPVEPWLHVDLIHLLPDRAQAAQTVFRHTGGIHAATLFGPDGAIRCQREDVGRHNAVDKVVGAMLAEDALPLARNILLLSGRAGFELVQKAVMAGIPVLAAIGAPSGLAVELAREFNLTLLGFVRDGRYNIYAGEERFLP